MAGKKLSPKQERFVQEYLIDLNATQAAIRAGYSAKTAQEQSSRLLSNAMVQEAISAAQAKHAQKLEVNAEKVLAEYCRIAFSDMGQILDFSQVDPHLRPANGIPEDARRAIASMKVRRTVEGSGEDSREVEVTEFKLWDKLNALEKLAKHLGLWKDQVEIRGKDGGPIEFIEVSKPAAADRGSDN